MAKENVIQQALESLLFHMVRDRRAGIATKEQQEDILKFFFSDQGINDLIRNINRDLARKTT